MWAARFTGPRAQLHLSSRLMALGETEPIDLTLDDDEDPQPPAKRARTDESGDSDIELVSEPQAAPCSSSAAPQEDHLGQDEDLIVTKHTGQVTACRSSHLLFTPDVQISSKPMRASFVRATERETCFHMQVWNQHLPHQRYQCGLHPFRTYTTRQNRKHCDQVC